MTITKELDSDLAFENAFVQTHMRQVFIMDGDTYHSCLIDWAGNGHAARLFTRVDDVPAACLSGQSTRTFKVHVYVKAAAGPFRHLEEDRPRPMRETRGLIGLGAVRDYLEEIAARPRAEDAYYPLLCERIGAVSLAFLYQPQTAARETPAQDILPKAQKG